MCGIVGAVAERNVVPILLEGLRRLEYRGYDSAGIATITDGTLGRRRRLGKVAELEKALVDDPVHSSIGIAHTRWATHGKRMPIHTCLVTIWRLSITESLRIMRRCVTGWVNWVTSV